MQPLSRPYSPYQNNASPTGIALPPAKRPRLSPNPQSPHSAQSPYPPPPALPESPYANYSPMTAGSPPAFNTPQPYAPSPMPGAMGPPPRPTQEKAEKEDKEKITDISDVTDVFHGSGIDLREEENYMTSTYRNVHKNQSFNTSFGSNTTVASPNTSFGLVSQGSFGSQPAFGGSGPISQPPVSQESIKDELDQKHRAAALAHNEKRQQHLNDSFLQANNIRHRMHRIAYDQGVALNVEGLYDKLPERPQGIQGVSATGPNGTAAAVKAHGLLQETAPLAEILTLVSLAANERVRSLVDESYAIARGRRYGSHGVVPPNLADLAIGEGESAAVAEVPRITNSAWEKVPQDNLGDAEGGVAKAQTPGKCWVCNGVRYVAKVQAQKVNRYRQKHFPRPSLHIYLSWRRKIAMLSANVYVSDRNVPSVPTLLQTPMVLLVTMQRLGPQHLLQRLLCPLQTLLVPLQKSL